MFVVISFVWPLSLFLVSLPVSLSLSLCVFLSISLPLYLLTYLKFMQSAYWLCYSIVLSVSLLYQVYRPRVLGWLTFGDFYSSVFKVGFWKVFLTFFVDFRIILEPFWTLLAIFVWFMDFCWIALPLTGKHTFWGFRATLSALVRLLLRVLIPGCVFCRFCRIFVDFGVSFGTLWLP